MYKVISTWHPMSVKYSRHYKRTANDLARCTNPRATALEWHSVARGLHDSPKAVRSRHGNSRRVLSTHHDLAHVVTYPDDIHSDAVNRDDSH